MTSAGVGLGAGERRLGGVERVEAALGVRDLERVALVVQKVALISQYGTGTKARRSSSRSTTRRSVGVCTRPTER